MPQEEEESGPSWSARASMEQLQSYFSACCTSCSTCGGRGSDLLSRSIPSSSSGTGREIHPDSASIDWREGHPRDDYTIGEILGVGATGKVFLGTHKASGDRVALKGTTSLLRTYYTHWCYLLSS